MEPKWIESICLVKFDIEIGQIVEWIQPLGSLDENEQKNVSMLSFPDSNAFSQNEGFLKYVFRMRRATTKAKFSFGYTLFMQKKDEDNPRGYTQKSIVILTNFPLVNCFYSILDLIYQNIQTGPIKNQLQIAYEQITQWNLPQTNELFKLDFFKKQIIVEIPHYISILKAKQNLNQDNDAVIDLPLHHMIQLDDLRERGQFQETNIYSALPHGMLIHLPKFWELVLTNQPFMVIADSPSQGSEIILGIISLISPLIFSGDYRPYFTIYDKEFQMISQELENSIVRNIVIGVTNPFFLKAYKKFPTIIRCDQGGNEQNRLQIQNKELCLKEDKQLMKMLMPLKNEETRAINNSVIKKVYKNMTLEFIGVFEMYFSGQVNELKRFEEKEFLEFVKGIKLSYSDLFQEKNGMIKLFQMFIRSSNFLGLLNERKNVYIAKGNVNI